MVSRSLTRKWKGVALGLAMLPGLSSLESRLWAGPSPAPFAAVKDAASPEAECKELVRKAREALQAGDMVKAEQLAKQAQALKVAQPFWERETPDSVLADCASTKAKAAPNADPKALLKMAREAANAGKFDEAQALATRSQAGNASWGKFGDTPAKCLDDIVKGRAKADKVESVKLLGEARKLYEQNRFDEAEGLAYRAERLHGPYAVTDFGDKPQKLLGDIQTARAKAKKNAPAVAKAPDKAAPPPSWDDKVKPAVAKGDTKNAVQQTAMNGPSPARVKAEALMADGKAAMQAGRMAEARAKFIEAQKTCTDFKPDEENPVRCTNELMALVNRQLADALKSGSPEKMQSARKMAADLGFDTKPYEAPVTQVKQATPETASTSASAGKNLLDKARLEMQRGQIEIARQLAIEVLNGPYSCQAEAAAVMRSIDAEEQNLKSSAASKGFEAALSAYQSKDYVQAMAIFRQVEAACLPAEQRSRMNEMLTTCRHQMQAQASVPSVETQMPPLAPPPASVVPGTLTAQEIPVPPPAPQNPGQTPATVTQPSSGSLADQVKAMQKVEFQRLRQECLTSVVESAKLFSRGETQRAVESLQAQLDKVKAASLEPHEVKLLCDPIEARLESFKVQKGQKDSEARINGAKSRHDQERGQRALAQDRKQEQIKELFKQYNRLTQEGKLAEAKLVAEKLKTLDPEDPAVVALGGIAQTKYNESSYETAKSNREKMFVGALNQAENPGPYVDSSNPLHVDPVIMQRANDRGKGIDRMNRLRTEAEREIQHKLSTTVDLSFSNAPLTQVIDDLRLMTGINFVVETPALDEERIALDTPVSVKLDKIKLESGLKAMLNNLHLTYVIADDVLKITTERKAKGRLETKIYRVADLVMPVEDYQQPNVMNLERAMQRVVDQQKMNVGTGSQPFTNGRNMLPNGQATGERSLTTAPHGTQQDQTLSQIGAPVTQKQTAHEMLMNLIKNTIAPNSWMEVNGAGTLEYMPIGMALVVNQTPDVQEQVLELLDALRRLQDLQIAIEVKLITLSETFFERIGLDFNLNVKTDHSTSRFEPQITTNQFKPAGQVNDFSPNRFIAGLNPAGGQFPATGSFTSDLDIPIKSSSFQYGIPPFAYPNNPGFDGGLSMGLAFLSDIQVYMFMEAAQGDRRIHVMQAPKLTLFNGQTATMSVQDQQFFVTNVGIVGFGGQIVFVPQNNPFPLGVEMTLQAVCSADRRFVRVNTNVRLANLASALVPLFPVTTFITPVFEGGAQGQPIPFTQFIQQPALSLISIQTTVSIPDGGTVILGGLKTLSEGRNEFGPPVLSKIPYVNRLFRNQGFGREAQSLLVMVTPRIIINAEEEEKQTGISSRIDN